MSFLPSLPIAVTSPASSPVNKPTSFPLLQHNCSVIPSCRECLLLESNYRYLHRPPVIVSAVCLHRIGSADYHSRRCAFLQDHQRLGQFVSGQNAADMKKVEGVDVERRRQVRVTSSRAEVDRILQAHLVNRLLMIVNKIHLRTPQSSVWPVVVRSSLVPSTLKRRSGRATVWPRYLCLASGILLRGRDLLSTQIDSNVLGRGSLYLFETSRDGISVLVLRCQTRR
jgi:hypothetical protein